MTTDVRDPRAKPVKALACARCKTLKRTLGVFKPCKCCGGTRFVIVTKG